MMFMMVAAFARETQDKDWITDPVAYAAGATAVIGTLIRSAPLGPNRRMAVQSIVSSLLTLLANDRTRGPRSREAELGDAASAATSASGRRQLGASLSR